MGGTNNHFMEPQVGNIRAVVIGSIDAADCIEGHDKLTKNLFDPSLPSLCVLTAARLTKIVEDWNTGAPNFTEVSSIYKTKLKHQPRGIYGIKKTGYAMIGIAHNLISQYKKLMMNGISTDYFETSKVEVYSPELEILLNISMGCPRIHIYPAGTGEIGAHQDSYNIGYGNIREQKFFILFDMLIAHRINNVIYRGEQRAGPTVVSNSLPIKQYFLKFYK
jgi:hypothetical protein